MFYSGNSYFVIPANLKERSAQDDLGQLVREDNPSFGKAYVYTCGDAGNRLTKVAYNYSLGSIASASGTTSVYAYNNADWGDQLAPCDGAPTSLTPIKLSASEPVRRLAMFPITISRPTVNCFGQATLAIVLHFSCDAKGYPISHNKCHLLPSELPMATGGTLLRQTSKISAGIFGLNRYVAELQHWHSDHI